VCPNRLVLTEGQVDRLGASVKAALADELFKRGRRAVQQTLDPFVYFPEQALITRWALLVDTIGRRHLSPRSSWVEIGPDEEKMRLAWGSR
jgi:hypothetical protein